MPLARALDIKLSRSGYTTQITYNGQEALDAVSKDTFDLVVLDLVMPLMDGFTFMQKVKSATTPEILVLSNLSQAEDIKKAKDLGAFDFLVKSNASLQNIVDYITAHLDGNK